MHIVSTYWRLLACNILYLLHLEWPHLAGLPRIAPDFVLGGRSIPIPLFFNGFGFLPDWSIESMISKLDTNRVSSGLSWCTILVCRDYLFLCTWKHIRHVTLLPKVNLIFNTDSFVSGNTLTTSYFTPGLTLSLKRLRVVLAHLQYVFPCT